MLNIHWVSCFHLHTHIYYAENVPEAGETGYVSFVEIKLIIDDERGVSAPWNPLIITFQKQKAALASAELWDQVSFWDRFFSKWDALDIRFLLMYNMCKIKFLQVKLPYEKKNSCFTHRPLFYIITIQFLYYRQDDAQLQGKGYGNRRHLPPA